MPQPYCWAPGAGRRVPQKPEIGRLPHVPAWTEDRPAFCGVQHGVKSERSFILERSVRKGSLCVEARTFFEPPSFPAI